MFASNLLWASTALAAMISTATAQSTYNYTYMGCLSKVNSAASSFNPSLKQNSYGNQTSVVPVCADYCRQVPSQYFAVIAQSGQCACGTSVNFDLTFNVSSIGCQLCGGNVGGQKSASPPGICGDTTYASSALYSLVF